jgi:hypothetical protein
VEALIIGIVVIAAYAASRREEQAAEAAPPAPVVPVLPPVTPGGPGSGAAGAVADFQFSAGLAQAVTSGNIRGAVAGVVAQPGRAAEAAIGTSAAGLTGGLSYLIPQLGQLASLVNDSARSAAARKGWEAVESGLEEYAARLQAAGFMDQDVRNYLVYTWAADFGIRGRNGLPPWPGKVPVRQSGILASERLRDQARASLLARGLDLPPAPLVDGSIVPGVAATPPDRLYGPPASLASAIRVAVAAPTRGALAAQ